MSDRVRSLQILHCKAMFVGIFTLVLVAGGSSVAKADSAAKSAVGVRTVAAASDFSSIFTSPELANSGWTSCPSPITWKVDSHRLSRTQSAREIANLTWAFEVWSRASGLKFSFGGTTRLTIDESTFSPRPEVHNEPEGRMINLAFIKAAGSSVLKPGVVGQGGAWAQSGSREIFEGSALFSVEHAKRSSVAQSRAGYLHELGHVLGLAHARNRANVMFPVVSVQNKLGPGDIQGVRTLMKPCAWSIPPAVADVMSPPPMVPSTPPAPTLPIPLPTPTISLPPLA